jgi:hypothetical protein
MEQDEWPTLWAFSHESLQRLISHANILGQPPVAEFEFEDEPESSLEGLEAYRLILAARERVQETDSYVSHNNNSVIGE